MAAAKVFSALLSYTILFLSSLVLSHSMSEMQIEEMMASWSGFDFIKPLKGSKKGDKVKGLYHLKKYMKRFGYIDHLPYNSTSFEADIFCDYLESAVKTYQTNFNLNSTGVLDTATVWQMMQPRCGVPDIINGMNSMRRPEVVPHFDIPSGNHRWPDHKYHLTYNLAADTPTTFYKPVHDAFVEWGEATGFRFTETKDQKNADLKFQLFKGDHNDGFPFDGPGGILAHATLPTSGICHFDAEENWVDYGPPQDGLDIQSVAMHEIGHLLGLGHSQYFRAIMWPSFRYGKKKRVLYYDDTQGINTLYPDLPN